MTETEVERDRKREWVRDREWETGNEGMSEKRPRISRTQQ